MDSYYTRAGATIAYEVTGSGSPVGYAHGVPLSRDAVRRLDLFDVDALGAGRRLLTYDQRGHGRSTGLPVVEDYRFDVFAADLLGLLDEAGIDEPIDMIGSSLGADNALRAALIAPDRFRRLVLMIPPVAWEPEAAQAKQWYFDFADLIETQGPAWREGLADAEPLPIFADYDKFDMTPQVPDELLPSILRGVGGSDLPAPDRIATLRHPTLILAWETDALHPVDTARRLHDLIPDSTLSVASTVADIKTWTTRIADFFGQDQL
jgi:non-heme chloroperoxidase